MVCQSHNDNYTYLSTKAQSSAQGLEHKSRPLIINMIRWLFRTRTETYLAISPLARAQKGILCDLVPPMVTSRIWLLGVGGVTSCHAAIRARWKESRSTDSRWARVRFIVPNFRRILEREIESDSFRNWFGNNSLPLINGYIFRNIDFIGFYSQNHNHMIIIIRTSYLI